jgi:hypothetical protein
MAEMAIQQEQNRILCGWFCFLNEMLEPLGENLSLYPT